MDELSPGLRASDADRERVAFSLQTAVSEGRLTLEEYDERVASVYAAKTYGDLAAVTADLPAVRPEPGRAAPTDPAWRGRPPAYRSAPTPVPAVGRAAWGAYLSANLVCFIVWACIAVGTSDLQDFWFLWVAGPWGAVLAAREISHRIR
ncbi:MAG TPA: DUF1707 domain-containing protein [Frankiaceae bacterium]|nr:DUF1707 domain-containing protein [Frankiaceae bacterium]